jgi:hypothetical protein
MFRALTVCALSGALVCAAVAWAADEELSKDNTASNLSALDPLTVWSRQASDGKYRLVIKERVTTLLSQPAPRDLPIKPADSPFDPDIGKSASGVLLVVYTRCAGVLGRNCDVYQFDGQRERKVKGASGSRCSEFAPSIWKGAVAFGRSGPGSCKGLYVKAERGGALRLDPAIPADTDIRAGKVAYLLAPSGRKSAIRVFTIRRGTSRAVITGITQEGERTRVRSPVFSGRYLYWLLDDLRRNYTTVGRSRGTAHSALEWINRSLPGLIDSIAFEGKRLSYINRSGVYEATDPVPKFSARD